MICGRPRRRQAELLRDAQRTAIAGVDPGHYEIILVDDGSTDATWDRIRELAAADPHVVAIKLSRNYGHQAALTAGLAAATGALVFVLDSDLQDPPELLGPMRDLLRAEKAEVVYGRRRSRKGETAFKRLTAAGFYRLLDAMTDTRIPLDTGDFRLMTRRMAEVLTAMPERDRFIRGMVSWAGFKQLPFDYDRDARHSGETKFSLRRMLRFASDALLSFSMVPLRLAGLLSALMFVGVVVLNLGAGLSGSPLGAIALICAAMSWAFGSVWSKRQDMPAGPMNTAAQMLCASVSLAIIALLTGERFPSHPQAGATVALAYLVVFGSIVAFSAYLYVLKTVRPALATSYAYVNPPVAVLFGVALAGEHVGIFDLAGMAVILVGVGIITMMRVRKA